MNQPAYELAVSVAAALAVTLFCCVFDILDKRTNDEVRVPFIAVLASALCIGSSIFYLLDGWHASAYNRHDAWAWAVLVFAFGFSGIYIAAVFIRWRIAPEAIGLKIRKTFGPTILVPWAEIESIQPFVMSTLRVETTSMGRLYLDAACRGIEAFLSIAKENGVVLPPETSRVVHIYRRRSLLRK